MSWNQATRTSLEALNAHDIQSHCPSMDANGQDSNMEYSPNSDMLVSQAWLTPFPSRISGEFPFLEAVHTILIH